MNNLKRLLTAAVTVCALAAFAFAQDTGDSTDRTAKPTTNAGHHHKSASKSTHKGKTPPDDWTGSGGSAGKSGGNGKSGGGFPDDWSQQGQSSSTGTGGKNGKGSGKGKSGGFPDDWSQQGQSASTGKGGKGKGKPKPKTASDDWETGQPK